MPLLLIPLLMAGVLALWALLLPLALIQRYRRGKLRRRARAWAAAINSALLLASALVLLVSAWVLDHWIALALAYAAVGLALGVVVGIVGLWLTRFEVTPSGLYYTPNRWLVLAVTLIVALRIAYGLVRAWQWWQLDGGAAHWLVAQGSLLAVGGLLIGHYLAYTFGLWRRSRALGARA
ncbi:MAG: DUF1453 domain-containing protein [Proteobacteria bacterium]|nr:DUF1453 domain-containing protein [Pseudomonadota bacterium]